MTLESIYPTLYRTIQVGGGLSIFYREAGPVDAPIFLLLHGLPSSSRMFEPLFARFSGRFHLVAPDYPGFGHSDWPDPKQFATLSTTTPKSWFDFTEALGLYRYTLYMQDYGGPVGFRMALAHPDRVEALMVQDAWPIMKDSARTGKPGVHSGPIGCLRKKPSGQICCRWRPRGRGMSETIRPLNATIRTSGPTNSPFLTSRDRRIFKAISFTITGPT